MVQDMATVTIEH